MSHTITHLIFRRYWFVNANIVLGEKIKQRIKNEILIKLFKKKKTAESKTFSNLTSILCKKHLDHMDSPYNFFYNRSRRWFRFLNEMYHDS